MALRPLAFAGAVQLILLCSHTPIANGSPSRPLERHFAAQLDSIQAAGQASPASQPSTTPPAEKESSVKQSTKPQTITIELVSNEDSQVQLGLQINGQYSYPFTFTANPQLTNGIQLSSSGVLTGKPTGTNDQNTTITIVDAQGKQVATYDIILHFSSTRVVLLNSTDAPSSNDGNTDTSSSPKTNSQKAIVSNSIYVGGDTITGSLLSPPGNNPNTPAPVAPADPPADTSQASAQSANKTPASNGQTQSGKSSSSSSTSPALANIPVVITREKQTFVALTDKNGQFAYHFSNPFTPEDSIGVSSSGYSSLQPVVPIQPQPTNILGEELRAIVGYQQAGASSSDFQQNWFVDFYISRPLNKCNPIKAGCGKLRWWGNVRIASYPQAGNQSVAELASGLATQVGALKLNQLAQGAEFLTGGEYVLWTHGPFRGFSENTLQTFSLGLIAGVGATGFFNSPSDNLQVFQVPAVGSPQLSTFNGAYPGVSTANVAFIAPDVRRFPKEYLAGVRLTTRYLDPTGLPLTSAPAMLAMTIGQNEVITGGRLQGVVGRVEAFYPLPFGNRGQGVAGAFSAIYLFGTAQLRLGGPNVAPALALQSVSNISASDPSVTLIPSPSVRDEYRIGFGVDLVSLISQLTGGTAKNSTTSAASPKSTNTGSQ